VCVDADALVGSLSRVLRVVRPKETYAQQLGRVPSDETKTRFHYQPEAKGYPAVGMVYDSGWQVDVIQVGISLVAGVLLTIVADLITGVLS